MNIPELLTHATKKLRWPKLIYPYEHGEIIISLCSKAGDPNFRNIAYINYKSGDTKHYLGAISKQNELQVREPAFGLTQAFAAELLAQVKTIHAAPVDAAKAVGQSYSYCCFCGTYITSKNSLAVGYGPICAENWGLPW